MLQDRSPGTRPALNCVFLGSLRSLSETMLEIMALMSSATTFDCKTNAFGAGMHFFQNHSIYSYYDVWFNDGNVWSIVAQSVLEQVSVQMPTFLAWKFEGIQEQDNPRKKHAYLYQIQCVELVLIFMYSTVLVYTYVCMCIYI